MINREEIEKLAIVIYEEVCRVWREQEKRPDPRAFIPWAEQDAPTRIAFISGAAAANTTIINTMVRRQAQEKS